MKSGPFPDVKSSDSFGSVNFMPRERKHIDGALSHRKRELSYGLNRIYVKNNAFFFNDLCNFLDGKDNTSLIISQHDGNNGRSIR